jgi:hypothetical protein
MRSDGQTLVDHMQFRHWEPNINSIPWIWGLALSTILTGRMVLADFSLTDDHWAVFWLGETGRLPFSKIWSTLLATEVGTLGLGGRFRPVYFLHRELEAWIFGDHTSLYYALRILYFGFFLGATCRIAVRCIGLVPALVVVTLATGLGFWSDLWGFSLGMSEQQAFLGISLFMIACDAIVPRFVSGEHIPPWALPVASLGTAIAAGSKENFVFLLAILGAIAIALAVTRRLHIASAIFAVPPLAVPALVLYALTSYAGNTVDFYGADNSVAHRLAEMLNWREVLARPLFVPFMFAATLLAIPLAWLGYRRSSLPRPQRGRATLVFIGFIGLLAAYTLWELFFYNGRLPSGIRFDFPILLLPPSVALGFAAFIRYALLPGGGLRWRSVQVASMALAVLCLACFKLPFSLPKVVQLAVQRTTALRHDFNVMRMTTSLHPDWPIVLEPNRPLDYEVTATFHEWAKFFGISNPIMLRVEVTSKDLTKFEQWLVGQMQQWGMVGKNGSVQPLPDPAALEKLNEHCFAVEFWRPIVSPCVRLDFERSRY